MYNGEKKVTYNADKLVSVHLIIKETSSGHPKYKAPREGSLRKLQLPRKQGYWENILGDRFYSKAELLACEDHKILVCGDDNMVYTKPYIMLKFVDGQTRNYFCDSEEEALQKYAFFYNQIKNPLLK